MVKKIIVLGAGPAGLVALIELMNGAKQYPGENFVIYCIEKRTFNFNRRQKLVNVWKEAFGVRSRYELMSWDEYCRKLFNPDGKLVLDSSGNLWHRTAGLLCHHSLTQPQKFLRKLLLQENNYRHPLTNVTVFKNFSIKELQFALFDYILLRANALPNVEIAWHAETQITHLDFEKKVATLKHNTELTHVMFDDLINSAGFAGDAHALINRHLPVSLPAFSYTSFAFPILHHCAVRLKLKQFPASKIERELALPFFRKRDAQNGWEITLLQQFQALGYRGMTLPRFYIIDDNYFKTAFNKTNVDLRFFVAGEIPDNLFFATDPVQKRNSIIKWATLLATMHYNIPTAHFEFDAKGETLGHSFNAQTFTTDLKFLPTPAVELDNGTRIFFIGDAAMNGFYPLGYSSIFALNDAISVADLILKPKLPLQNYLEMKAYYRNVTRDGLDGMNELVKRDFNLEYDLQKSNNDRTTLQENENSLKKW